MLKANRNQTGTIFNIQKFSLHDGPGIRTVVFFKGCPLHCQWCANPESQLAKPQILWNQKKCNHCQICLTTCQQQAIQYHNNRIYIQHNLCNACTKCINTCTQDALTLQGETKTVQEVLDIVLQDRPFYEESHGGITLSGGECLIQKDFALALLQASKEEGLHTCCETTGYIDPDQFLIFLPYLDKILFDVKHWQFSAHQKGTGVSLEIPLKNLQNAIAMDCDVLVRIPVIPNFNDQMEDAKQFVQLFKTIGVKQCQLLPFHQFGESKYNQLGKDYAYHDIIAIHKEDLQEYLSIFNQNQIHAYI